MFERMLKYFEQRPMGERRKSKMQNFISFLMALIIFKNFQKCSLGIITSLSKVSLQGTIVPGRLRSEFCPWAVKLDVLNITIIKKNIMDIIY